MKYEICKRSKIDKDIWSAVAWADTWEWADKIAVSLNFVDDGNFAVFKDGKMIKTIGEAMK